jgi:hypothetical protein
LVTTPFSRFGATDTTQGFTGGITCDKFPKPFPHHKCTPRPHHIIPTLSHSRGVDFFIDGISYDQKVARSPTKEFKRDFGENWKQKAIKNPSLVAKYLYQYQDKGRFGASPRLLIVYLDEEITPLKIKHIIENTSLEKPLEITFDFNHRSAGVQTYRTEAFVILLYNNI